jgi:hypothetical protein
MDYRAIIFLVLGSTVAVSTWYANRSGEAAASSYWISREKHPRLFKATMIARVALAVLMVSLAGAIAFGWIPVNSN